MNILKKNIIVVGFDQLEKNSISLPYASDDYGNSQNVYFYDSLKDAYSKQGFMLIIDNKDNISVIELDKKYRRLFNKYEMVVIYNESYFNLKSFSKWTNIYTIGRDIFDGIFFDTWHEYKDNLKIKKNSNSFSRSKSIKIKILKDYVKNYKTRKTSDISKDLNISERTIERYMNDLNNMYHNIGYDYSLNEWYFFNF